MLSYVAIFVAGFISIFALGFQSRNVNTGRIKSAMATSFVIALSQGTIYKLIPATSDWSSLLVYGLSGSIGVAAAMKAHAWLHERPDRTKPA